MVIAIVRIAKREKLVLAVVSAVANISLPLNKIKRMLKDLKVKYKPPTLDIFNL